ncbi:MAG: hypothetical protein L6461_10865 [Anaerolineae bacterium]|jgi:hypothetical protein|nr:hypothetical protein [Anaerolineae bacterium]
MSQKSKPFRLKKPSQVVKTPGALEQLNKINAHKHDKIDSPKIKTPSVKIPNIRIRTKRPHA